MTPTATRREEILAIARKRMMHYGIQKTTMNDIAAEAGMAVGSLYLHFRNKDEIVLAIAEDCRAEQAAAAGEILASALPPQEKLRHYMRDRFAYVRRYREENPQGQQFVRLLVQIDPDCGAVWQARFEDCMARILAEGVTQGLFRVPDIARDARVFFHATDSFYPLPFLELPAWPLEADLMRVVDWFIEHWMESARGEGP